MMAFMAKVAKMAICQCGQTDVLADCQLSSMLVFGLLIPLGILPVFGGFDFPILQFFV